MGELLNSTPSNSSKDGWRFSADRRSAFRTLLNGRPRDSLTFPAGCGIRFELCFRLSAEDGREGTCPDSVKLYLGDGKGAPLAVPAERVSGSDGGPFGEDAESALFFADICRQAGLPKGGGVGYEIFDKSDALGTASSESYWP